MHFLSASQSDEITPEKLFDSQYQPIEDTDPQQFMTGFVQLTDKRVSPILMADFRVATPQPRKVLVATQLQRQAIKALM